MDHAQPELAERVNARLGQDAGDHAHGLAQKQGQSAEWHRELVAQHWPLESLDGGNGGGELCKPLGGVGVHHAAALDGAVCKTRRQDRAQQPGEADASGRRGQLCHQIDRSNRRHGPGKLRHVLQRQRQTAVAEEAERGQEVGGPAAQQDRDLFRRGEIGHRDQGGCLFRSFRKHAQHRLGDDPERPFRAGRRAASADSPHCPWRAPAPHPRCCRRPARPPGRGSGPGRSRGG